MTKKAEEKIGADKIATDKKPGAEENAARKAEEKKKAEEKIAADKLIS